MNIQYCKWNKQDIQLLHNSFRHVLNLKEPQLYYPIMSLFFYIHNTPNSHKFIDFKKKSLFERNYRFSKYKRI